MQQLVCKELESYKLRKSLEQSTPKDSYLYWSACMLSSEFTKISELGDVSWSYTWYRQSEWIRLVAVDADKLGTPSLYPSTFVNNLNERNGRMVSPASEIGY